MSECTWGCELSGGSSPGWSTQPGKGTESGDRALCQQEVESVTPTELGCFMLLGICIVRNLCVSTCAVSKMGRVSSVWRHGVLAYVALALCKARGADLGDYYLN